MISRILTIILSEGEQWGRDQIYPERWNSWFHHGFRIFPRMVMPVMPLQKAPKKPLQLEPKESSHNS